ncbi:MAG: hypothetical protein AABY09_00430, partial [Nanoarchaeota archaeon]
MHLMLKEKAVMMIYLVISLTFLISISHVAYAQEGAPAEEEALPTNSCCEKTTSGETCLYTRVEECDASGQIANFQYCEETPFCKVGCCVSEEDGSCSRQTSKGTCEAEGFKWYDSPTCEVNECKKGCCVLSGASCAYVTEGKCDKILLDYPELTKDFREADSEITCTNICREQDRGCCVSDGGDTCMWNTRGNCAMQDGTGGEGFYKDVYCSNENLPCDCEARQEKHCLEGEEDVLWFDSCNNPEDIAEDCDYAKLSTLCSEPDEANTESYCKSVNCVTTWADPTSSDPINGGLRYNGEAWCSYDALTGPSFDVVGSRHYRHICINGEEMVEPCKDFREEMCMSLTLVDDLIKNVEMKNAKCQPNRWKECTTTCNTAKDAADTNEEGIKLEVDKKCCERSDLRDCIWVSDETGGVCMPKIAPGLKFWTDTTKGATPDANAVAECEKGKREITAKWGRHKLETEETSPWECKENCDAYKDEILDNRNQMCRSFGDCGAHYNYKGEFSETGFMRSWVKEPDGDPKIYVTPDMAGDFQEKWLQAGNALDMGKFSAQEYWGKMGGTAGYGGVITGGVVGALAAALIVAVVIAFTTSVATMSATTSAFLVAMLAASGAGPFGIIVVVAILIAAALTIMFTWPETEDRVVTFTCTPWQAPPGGDKCSECDKPFKQCSEYRCRSLGSTCKFIQENEGTGRQTCYDSAPDDVSRPKMSPDEQVFKVISKKQDITDRFSITRSQAGYAITPEIPAFAKVIFGVKTDELSQCYIDTDFKNPFKFSDLKQAFPDTYFSTDHNITYNNLKPNIEHKYYISCRDNNGNPRADEYIVPYIIELKTDNQPDMSPPHIIATEMPKLGKTPAHENETIIMVDVDEASDFGCRIAEEDRDFELMDQVMPCAHQPAESVLSAYNYCIA